mgnify:CR=1 FL=1
MDELNIYLVRFQIIKISSRSANYDIVNEGSEYQVGFNEADAEKRFHEYHDAHRPSQKLEWHSIGHTKKVEVRGFKIMLKPLEEIV